LDLAGRLVDALKPAASDRFAVEPRQDEDAGRRDHLGSISQALFLVMKAALETRLKFVEIRAEALASVRAVRRFWGDFHRGGADQPLYFAHRRHQPAALSGVQGLEHRRRELVRKPVVSSALN